MTSMVDTPVAPREEMSSWILSTATRAIHSTALRQKVKILAVWVSEGLVF